MAIGRLLEALPLARFTAADVALAFLVTAVLGLVADYSWMLYLRSKMVCTDPMAR